MTLKDYIGWFILIFISCFVVIGSILFKIIEISAIMSLLISLGIFFGLIVYMCRSDK